MNPLFYLAAIPIFGLLVIVHEFGHFITAKWSGIRVEEFSIGFPPRLFGIQRGETLYSINLLPLGGYVRMPGENGDAVDENGVVDPRSFGAKPAGNRFLVLVAGVVMNLLLTIVLFTLAEAVPQVQYAAYIGSVVSGSPAQAAGLKSGDHILSVNGHHITYFSDLSSQTNSLISNANPNEKTLPIVLVVEHAGQSQPVTLTVQARLNPPKGQGSMGISADLSHPVHIQPNILTAPIRGVQDIGLVATGTVQGIREIVRGIIPINKAVSGPVGIATISAQTAQAIPQEGWYPILFLAGFLSLNLAFFNVLPLPGLDGGRLLFVIIEVLRRGKRVSPQREALVHAIGLAALLCLVALVTINDIGAIGH